MHATVVHASFSNKLSLYMHESWQIVLNVLPITPNKFPTKYSLTTSLDRNFKGKGVCDFCRFRSAIYLFPSLFRLFPSALSYTELIQILGVSHAIDLTDDRVITFCVSHTSLTSLILTIYIYIYYSWIILCLKC